MDTADGVLPKAVAASDRLPNVATVTKHLSISILITKLSAPEFNIAKSCIAE
jgi:hypothetical protein